MISPSTPKPDAAREVARRFGRVVDVMDMAQLDALRDAASAAAGDRPFPRWSAHEGDGVSDHPGVVHDASVKPLPPPTFLNGRPNCFPDVVYEGFTVSAPEMSLRSVMSGHLLLVNDAPCVLDSRQKLIERFSSLYSFLIDYYADEHHAAAFANVRYIDGRLLVLVDDIYSLNYSHWLSDWLPRVSALGRVNEDDYVAVSPLTTRWQVETLRAMGFAEHRIIPMQPWSVVRARELLVPSALSEIFHPSFKAADWATDFIRRSLGPPSHRRSTTGRRIYISRGDAGGRRVLNEPQLIDALAPFGFEVHSLSEMTVARQAALFADASVIVSLHGAGLTNVIFCNVGCRVCEIFPQSYGTPAFWILGGARGVDYFSYVETDVRPGQVTVHDDIMLDIPDFLDKAGFLLS